MGPWKPYPSDFPGPSAFALPSSRRPRAVLRDFSAGLISAHECAVLPPSSCLMVSWGYLRTVLQTGWLRTTEVYPLIVLEARDQDPGVVQVMPAPEAPGAPFLPLPAPWQLLAFLACGRVTPGLDSIFTQPLSSCVSLLPSFSSGNTCGSGDDMPTLMTLGDSGIISLVTSTKSLSPKVTFRDSKV